MMTYSEEDNNQTKKKTKSKAKVDYNMTNNIQVKKKEK